MKPDNRFEDTDKAALLRIGHICPNCSRALNPAAFYKDVWLCRPCHESWYLPKVGVTKAERESLGGDHESDD